jgi:hypothetical protein
MSAAEGHDPPQVPPTVAVYPLFAVIVNVACSPSLTICVVFGLMLPFSPDDGVTI